jgi:Na+/proline symporter
MELAKLEDKQKSHEQTQLTIRNGDNQKGAIKWVRPLHATVSLAAAILYVFNSNSVDWMVLTALLALPASYAGLREFGKHSFNKNVK